MTTTRTIRRGLAGILAALTLVGTLAGCGSANTSTGASNGAASPTSTLNSAGKHISRVSVHDPSVVKANGKYYVFGSHRAWAKSNDLVNWHYFKNNLSRDYEKIFADIWKAWPKQAANPDVKGNMWAPDVVWNPSMNKWCMYLSLNGANYQSVIVLLTANNIEGDWTYVGPVVYSGFNDADKDKTDVPRVLGESADIGRYLSADDTEINAIDPSVKADDNGDMWMTFGSWFGGMWMLKLDSKTGLRDYAKTYPTITDQSDGYYGVKLGGGYGNSGEGSYLLHTNGWWYLFTSYGHLEQTGGYQIRMFRSKSITGPYLDENGNPAVSTSAEANNWEGDTGVRLMASTVWSGTDKKDIEVSQGHNSALADSDGTDYLIYHTRFSDRGETHEIRTRQLLPTADGWLTAAPYEYTGTKAKAKGYPASKLAGTYEFAMQNPNTYFKGPKRPTDKKSTDYKGINQAKDIKLTADGKVSGDRTGTWKAEPGSNRLTITLDGITYQGAFALLPRDKDGKTVMTFSAIGDNICVWGSQR
ncbi:glycoside hydrolase family 43 protein [Bifidobacterium sp. ESL0704]|uniref:glycoside hydrolase family 43 protein n=1 Tax=Bifidobacterium sp. ESL0704 TaxID=2983219 RepID=UPI0023F72437|nr:glycoside hydrolase family 43 protein [Bifidobacterium sp. ESL0704]WEV53083.1 glycoside hydrolase family 43 protein [Bifidobacterium sp. ESL0704]